MVLKISRDLLAEALKQPVKAVASRSVNAVFTMLHIETDGSTMNISGSDGDLMVKTTVATIQESGAFLIDAKTLLDLVAKMPAGDISIDTAKSPAVIKSARSKYNIPIMPPDNYPKALPQGEKVIEIAAARLATALEMVSHCCVKSVSGAVHYTNGVHFNCVDGHLDVVATDGHRLALARIDIEGEVPPFNMLIPEASVRLIISILTGKEGNASINRIGNQLFVTLGNITLSTGLYDVKFPDYLRVIPKDHAWQFIADKDQLLHCLEREMVLTRRVELNPTVVISGSKGNGAGVLTISADAGESGDGNEEIEAEINSSIDFGAGYNIVYLNETVKQLTGQVKIQGANAASPILVTSPSLPDYQEVVMPIRTD
jgi:DNA polymerase-3 subunit beta